MTPIYDHGAIAARRGQGWTWADIAVGDYGNRVTGKQLRQAHSLWRKRQGAEDSEARWADYAEASPGAPPPLDGDQVRGITLNTEDVKRVKSLEDVLHLFDVDPEEWEVERFWVTGNSWDQSVKDGTVAHQYKVTAQFRRRIEKRLETAKEEIQQIMDDWSEHTPAYLPVTHRPPQKGPLTKEPVMAVLAVFDPHIGMMAWGKEVGEDYDTRIAYQDYLRAVESLLLVAGEYDLDKILYVVGNDLAHVDALATDAKGNRRGGATTAGTSQDVDTRIARLFTTIRKALVEGIDESRLLAPTEALVVPGNHDSDTMYRMGEVLAAWYRQDPEVDVVYGPKKRKFTGYGRNAFMLTHGEEYKRKRDNLPLIMATECPADLWVGSEDGCREVLTGHNHIALQGGYYPTAEVDESRAVRTRSLPALTPEDSWHFEQGYKHQRAATLLLYRKSGGLAGLHEFNL